MESVRIGIELNAKLIGKNELFNINNNIINTEYFDEHFDVNNLNEFEISIILCLLLFCDDTTLVCGCPYKMQRLIDVKFDTSFDYGMQLHPKKCKSLYLKRKHLNLYQNNYKIKMLDATLNERVVLEDKFDICVKTLGITFKTSYQNNLDFNIHIDNLCEETGKQIDYMRLGGFERICSQCLHEIHNIQKYNIN